MSDTAQARNDLSIKKNNVIFRRMDFKDSVYNESTVYGLIRSLMIPYLRSATCDTIYKIFNNFFFFQYVSAFLPGRVPVTKVDHPLDEKIPFKPSWVTIYIDFTQFWIRMIAFFLRRYGKRAYTHVRDLTISMGKLYLFASEIYRKNLSTTKRPFYIGRPRFFMIHVTDPHLMCIPSLHVMIVIHAYTVFIDIINKLGDEEKYKEQVIELKQGALAICQAIFFVKQHSINCMPAALYAMTCYNEELFPVKAAEDFISLLFSPAPKNDLLPKNCRIHPAVSPATKINKDDQEKIKSHIRSLYNRFIEEGKTSASWKDPVLNFLRTYSKQ